jgi:hypothetical protein
MIKVSQNLRGRYTSEGHYIIESNPLRRIIFSSIALLLIAGMISALLINTSLSPAGSPAGLLFYIGLTLVSLGVGLSKKEIQLTTVGDIRFLKVQSSIAKLKITEKLYELGESSSLQLLELRLSRSGKEDLTRDVGKNGKSGFFSSRYLCKTYILSKDGQIFIDETTDVYEARNLAREISSNWSIPLETQESR